MLVVYKDGVAKRAAASMFRGDTGTFSPEDLQRVTDLESGKVDKVTGKGLSSNDYTDADKGKVAAALTQHQDISGKVDKVSGKGLSSNDYTDADKAKVAAALTQHQDISGKVDKVSGKGLSTNDYTDADKAKVAAALTQHQDISGKVDKVSGKGLSSNDYTDADKAKVAAALTQHQDISGKVDKVTGKGLSTNDYTTAEKNKLLGIEAGAQVNEVTSEHYRSMMAMLNVVRVQDVGFQKQFENFRAVFENFLYVQGVPVYMTAVGVGLIRIRDAAAGQIHFPKQWFETTAFRR